MRAKKLNKSNKTPVSQPNIIRPGEAPWNAEAHFADYDHDAVKELSSKTIICPATYERKGTVRACVGSTYAHRLAAKVYLHDDGSQEYDAEWLQQFADRVYRHPHGAGGKRGVKNLRSNIVKSILGDFEPETFKPWLEEDFGPKGPEFLYMVDSDGYHDPHFFYRLHEIMEIAPQWGVICLYNAKFHSPRGGRREQNVIDRYTVMRGMSAGISMFFRMSSFRSHLAKVQIPDGRGWDGYYSREVGERKVVTSLVSYVEHFGKWGFHNKGNFDRDRAIHPTKRLVEIRDATIKQIEREYKVTQRQVAQKMQRTGKGKKEK